MVEFEQLEMDVMATVKEASVDPITADLKQLWLAIEPILEQLPEIDRLRVAGEAIARLAEVCHLKAEKIFADWQECHNDEGPVITDDLLAGLVQRTMYLDISDLIRQQTSTRKRRTPKPAKEGTVVGIVDKEKLLAVVEAEDAKTAKQVVAIAHNENVAEWIAAIAQWMSHQTEQSVALLDLQRSLQMPLIEVWLALLLGGFGLESRGSFYDSDQIWVSTSNRG